MTDSEASTPPDGELTAIRIRLLELEQRVDELSDRLGNLVQLVAQQGPDGPPRPAEPQPPVLLADPPTGEPDQPAESGAAAAAPAASRGMLRVIQHISQGDGETAQRELQALPQEELASQPAVVALVAAALFVQRGDLEAGLKALKQARGLTDDPRLLKLISLLESQSS